jgi:NifU-like protein involved in Fe-S cluster formation
MNMNTLPQSLELLYHKQMIALTQKPSFFVDADVLVNPTCVRNPMCGDALCFGYKEKKIYWHGEGCLICLASAEALCQILCDSNNPELTCYHIYDYFNGNSGVLPDKFLPLASVKQVKTRIKCVILSVDGVINLIKGCNT